MPYKLVVVVRKDLKLPKGKMAVQVAHAAVNSALDSDKGIVDEWLSEGGKKVALWCEDRQELAALKKMAESKGLNTAVIIDAGLTVLKPGTITCLGIGPDEEKRIDEVTGQLKMI
jgi:peptidyl-tRNA hydrolase, PTH2 family